MDQVSLEKNVPIPLYYQIEQFLRDQITSGELKPGDQILTEEKLTQKFSVSRATVRRAISDLVYEGLLERNYSKGTVVTQPKITQGLFEATSFTNDIMKSGKVPHTKILEFKKIFREKSINTILGLDETEGLHFIKRVRYVDDIPVCVEEIYMPVKSVPDLSLEFFKEEGINQSTYHVLKEHYNVHVRHVEDTMSAETVGKRDAVLLDIPSNSPVLLRERVSYDSFERPISYSNGRYIIKINLSFNARNV